MYILLSLLLSTVPAVPPSTNTALCQEIATVLIEGVEAGYIKEHEAAEMLSRCAGRPE